MDLLLSLAAETDRLDLALGGLLEHFRDERIPLLLSLAIVSIAVALLALLILWSAAAWLRIGRVRRQLRACGTGAAFRQNFAAADRCLAASLFGDAWREYRQCLKTGEEGMLYPRRPDEYLGLHAMAGRAYPARFFAAAHGYFIGVGLLLTFVGLVAALKFAAAGVASPDLAVAKASLNALLAAAAFKFMTSIAGLGSSLALSIAARSATCLVESAAQNVACDLERAMSPLVAESLAFDQLAATRQQLLELRQIGATLAVQAAPAASADAERNAALQHMLEGFAAELRGAAAGEMKQMSQRLAAVGDAMGSMQSHIDRSGEQFAGQLGLAASRLNEAAMRLQHGLDSRADAMAARFAQSEAMVTAAAEKAADGLVSGFAAFDASLKTQIVSMREIVGGLDRAGQALDGSAAAWRESAAPVTASVEASRATAAELSLVADRVGAAQRDMAEMAKAVAQLSDKVGAVWSNYSSRFEQVDHDLAAAFAQLQGGTRAFGDEFMKFVSKLDSSLASGMEAFSVGTEELREVVQLLVDKPASSAGTPPSAEAA